MVKFIESELSSYDSKLLSHVIEGSRAPNLVFYSQQMYGCFDETLFAFNQSLNQSVVDQKYKKDEYIIKE